MEPCHDRKKYVAPPDLCHHADCHVAAVVDVINPSAFTLLPAFLQPMSGVDEAGQRQAP
jgi:hypothetical protein